MVGDGGDVLLEIGDLRNRTPRKIPPGKYCAFFSLLNRESRYGSFGDLENPKFDLRRGIISGGLRVPTETEWLPFMGDVNSKNSPY